MLHLDLQEVLVHLALQEVLALQGLLVVMVVLLLMSNLQRPRFG